MRQDFRSKLIINISLSFGFVAIVIAVIIFLGTQIGDKSNKIFGIQSELRSNAANVSELARLRELSKSADPYLARLNAALPKKDELLSLQKLIEASARRHNLSFGFKFGGETKGDGVFSSIGFNINAQGAYSSALSFLKELEDTYKLMKISSVDIIGQGDRYTLVLAGEIFFNEQ